MTSKHLVPFALVAGVAGLAAAPATQAASRKYSPADKAFVQTSISGDRFEIEGGETAAHLTGRPAVSDLADTLVRDHSRSLHDSVRLAHALGITVPRHPTPPMRWELRAAARAGADFDRAWTVLEIADHKQDIAEAVQERRAGTNPSVRKMAAQELPVLRKHLGMARAARRAIG